MSAELFLPATIQVDTVQYKTVSGKHVSFHMARLDRIHPVISGNKLFKLYYNLKNAIQHNKGIITMGGAYSNHLPATAHACSISGIPSVGLVRGEISGKLNHTLQYCREQGMKLISIARKDYDAHSQVLTAYLNEHPQFLFVPQGGENEEGIKGCEEIPKRIPGYSDYTHIICAAGTGTTIRGITRASAQHQQCIALPVLKIKAEEQNIFAGKHLDVNINCLFDFAGKGYAKKDTELFAFMNDFFDQTGIPLDFVYTAKLLKAVSTLYDADYFSHTHRLLVIHTGGLQGNDSLLPGTLLY